MGNGSSAPAAPAPAGALDFRVHGWRWHHLGVVGDLRRIAGGATAPALCGAGGAAQRADLARVYAHVLDDNWGVHDAVEVGLFFPWVRARAGRGGRLTLAALSARRAGMRRRREALRGALAAFGPPDGGGGGGAGCGVRVMRVQRELRALADDAARLFAAEEGAVVPLVKRLFSPAEQDAFNRDVIRSLSAREARVALVVFRDAVRGSPRESREFERQVPAPVRVLVPYWRRKFAHIRTRFFGAL